MRILSAAALLVVGVGVLGCESHQSGKAKDEGHPVPHVLQAKTDASNPAVVALRMASDFYCTGTVIAPRYVLTAAHCFNRGASNVSVSWRSNIFDGGGWKRATHVSIEPGWTTSTWGDKYEHDLAVVELAEPTTVTPVPVNFDVNAAQHLSEVRMVGFGPTGTGFGNQGTKRSATVPVTPLASFFQTPPGRGSCYGDSGGPSFGIVDGVEKIVSVTSHGLDPLCERAGGRQVRTDVHRAFLARFVDAPDVPTPPSPPVLEEPVAVTPPAPAPVLASAPVECSGDETVTVMNRVVTSAAGPAIRASGNCKISLVGVNLHGPIGIEATGNATVSMTGGTIDAATDAVTTSTGARVNLVGTHFTGPARTTGSAILVGAS